jgi:hypothetical protein
MVWPSLERDVDATRFIPDVNSMSPSPPSRIYGVIDGSLSC